MFLEKIAILALLLISISDGRNSVFAADIQLRMLNGTRRSAVLINLGQDSLLTRNDQDVDQSAPLAELKSITFDRKFKESNDRKTVVQLTNGDLFLVESISMLEDAFVVSIGDGNLSIPLEFVRNVFFDSTVFRFKEPTVESQGTDTVILKNGDVVRGELILLQGTEVEVLTELGKLKFPQTQVQSMTFDPQLAAKVPVADNFVQLFLENGSVLSASRWQYDSKLKQFDLELFSANHLKVRIDDLSRIEFWNSNIVPLGRLLPIRFSSEDFFGNPHPFGINQSLSNHTLVCGQSVYTSGFAVRSRSNLVFKAPANASAFVTSLGFDDRLKKTGDVDVQVSVGRQVAWKDSLSHQLNAFIDVPLISVQPQQELILQVDFGKHADIGDHIIWCQPYFVLQK